MSVENNIFMVRDKLPSPQEWIDAIKSNGFEMEMDTNFDVVEHEGFLPCKYQGMDAGFEYWTEEVDIDEFLEDEMLTQEEAKHLGNRYFMVTLTTHSDFREYMTSMIAAAVLCELSDGMLAEGGEPPFISADKALTWAKDCEPEIQKQL